MAIRRKRVDGGILFIKCYTRGGIVPFKLQALEVDELDEVQSKPNYEGNKVVGGIEYNSYNKAVGYWIKEYDIEGYLKPVSRFVEFFIFQKHVPLKYEKCPKCQRQSEE